MKLLSFNAPSECAGTVPAEAAALSSGDEQAQHLALLLLRDDPTAFLERADAMLRSSDPEVRRAGAKGVLGRGRILDEAASVQRALALLDDPDWGVVDLALHHLWMRETSSVIDACALRHALESPEPLPIVAAWGCEARLAADPRNHDALLQVLRRRRHWEIESIVSVFRPLARHDPGLARRLLEIALEEPDERGAAILGGLTEPGPGTLPLCADLRRLLVSEHRSRHLRAAAAATLASLQDASAVPLLLGILAAPHQPELVFANEVTGTQHHRDELLTQSLLALGRLHATEAIAPICGLLREAEPGAVAPTLEALELVGVPVAQFDRELRVALEKTSIDDAVEVASALVAFEALPQHALHWLMSVGAKPPDGWAIHGILEGLDRLGSRWPGLGDALAALEPVSEAERGVLGRVLTRIGWIGPATLAQWERDLSDPERRDLAVGMLRIAGRKAESRLPAMLALARSDDLATRSAALLVLPALAPGSSEVLDMVKAASGPDSPPELRRAAGIALRELGAGDLSEGLPPWSVAGPGSDGRAEALRRLLFRVLAAAPTQNFVASPASMLAVLALAARASANALDFEALGLRAEDLQPEAMGRWHSALAADEEGFKVRSSLAAFLRAGLETDPAVVAELRCIGAQIQEVELSDRRAAATEVNGWVREATSGAIPSLLSPGDLHEDTLALFVNALWLKGVWKKPFETTSRGLFRLLSGALVETTFLEGWLEHRFFEDEQLQAVEVAYRDDRGAMLFVAPRVGFFERVRKLLTPEGVAALRRSMELCDFDFQVPQFDLSQEHSLDWILETLGSREAPSRLHPGESVRFNQMRQVVRLCIDQYGTEAAAATFLGGIRGVPQVVAFDRPFFFFVHDAAGQCLFGGQVVEP
ncbi:MAG: serpin family protein [Myxococcales bacterium]